MSSATGPATHTPVENADLSGPLTARWITLPAATDRNCAFLARRAFRVDGPENRAILRVTADSQYVVFLNGRRIGDGPARGTHRRFFYDSFDVVAALRPGENHLAVRVLCPVTPLTSAAPPVAPALWAQVDGLAYTDASWQVRTDPAHRSDAPFYTHHIGYSECRDLRKEIPGWETFQDGNAGWSPAVEIGDGVSLGGRAISPRPIPPLTDARFRPIAAVDCGGVPPHAEGIESDVEYAALMQQEMHLHATRQRFENLDALLHGGTARVLPPRLLTPESRGDGAFILLDFGREIVGNIHLDVEAPAGTILDVAYDEAVVNGRVDPRRVNPNGSVYRFADRYILRQGRQCITNRPFLRGFRALQLVFRRFGSPVTLHGVEAAHRVYPMPLRAAFQCDRPFLNRLWEMCIATISACSLDLMVDCPWREQTLWLGDQKHESLLYMGLTGDARYAAHNLRVTAEGALPNGLLPARYPSERGCLLPITNAAWVMTLHDYYVHTGDAALVRELLPVADDALAVYRRWTDADGLTPDQHGDGLWNFIDWGYEAAGARLGGKTAALNLSIAIAFDLAGELHRAVGDSSGGEHWTAQSRAVMQAVRRRFRQHDSARFCDCTDPADGRVTFSQVVHALALAGGQLEPAERCAALAALRAADVIPAEYGYLHFVLDGLARHGRAPDALQIIHERWGRMVESGSPTVWEVYDGRDSMSGCGSLCHGFSCAPIHFLQTTVLGIRPLKPGFARVAFQPQSLGLLWARGSVPTPKGDLAAAWALEEGETLLAELRVPDGIEAILFDGRRLAGGVHRLHLPSAPAP